MLSNGNANTLIATVILMLFMLMTLMLTSTKVENATNKHAHDT